MAVRRAESEPKAQKPRGKRQKPPEPPVARRAGCFGITARMALLGSLAAAAMIGLGGGVLGGLYEYYIVLHPGPEFAPDNLRKIISQESPVYYRDGVTPVGVFFENEHRVYVPFDALPEPWIVSIVAAEDSAFWTHPGFSVKHLVRAMRDDLLAGSVVAGGSTLTQQTAKNLFYRPDRSARSKGIELVNALRLEAHFSKSEILTFYANQFHVTGNGRGFGIAARHFFDKEPEDLTLLECAFLAGLVKAPAYYDPFQGDEATRRAAIARANDRTTYVLGRIAEVPAETLAGPMPISGDASSADAYQARVVAVRKLQDEARHLLADGFQIPFKHGTFRYESSAVLDEVARRLAAPPFDKILGDKGLDPASGLVVVTTLDPDAEREATYGLWHHLSEAGTWLEQLDATDYVHPDMKPPRFDPDFPPRTHEFRYGAVAAVLDPDGKKHLQIDLGGSTCVVDRDGMARAAVAVYRGQKRSSSAKAPGSAVDDFVDALPVGSVVWVSVRSVPEKGPALCDLEVRPELQGSVVVLDHGQMRAMVGGNDNRNFNRATALRQFGSTWKPLVYHSALQLGWSPADVLDNRRNVFSFSGSWYWPSPDHAPADRVSMAWAGVNSENLASVWLLYHLTDRLDGAEVQNLARSLDLARRSGEDADAYRTRIQKLGVLPTPARVEESAYFHARRDVLRGIAETAHPEDELALTSMPYGWGYDAERAKVAGDAVKTAAIENSWTRFSARVATCKAQYAALAGALADRRFPLPAEIPDLTVDPVARPFAVACGTPPAGYVAFGPEMVDQDPPLEIDSELPTTAPEPVPEPQPERHGLFGHRGDPEPEARPKPDRPPRPPRIRGPDLQSFDDVPIDLRLHGATADAVQRAIDRQHALWDGAGRPDLYDPEILYWNQDFRALLGLRYVTSLAEAYGVVTDLQEVLSLPLGASEITLEEAASLYTGLVSGLAWEFPGVASVGPVATPADPALLIAEIRDVDGRVLYRADSRPKVVAPAETAALTADILRNVVRFGTGRRADDAIQESGLPVPVGGKTGTTNDYKNVAFLGYAPVATPAGYDPANGLIVGAYVGYDDNRPLTNGGIRLAGASGALPAWIGTVQGLQSAGLLGHDVPTVASQGGAWALVSPPGVTRIPAEAGTGLPLTGELVDLAQPSMLVAAPKAPEVEFDRLERPSRVAPGTEEIPSVTERRHRHRDDDAWSEPAAPDATEPD
jgi:membrane peptidoglycan carboxypeptidase